MNQYFPERKGYDLFTAREKVQMNQHGEINIQCIFNCARVYIAIRYTGSQPLEKSGVMLMSHDS